MGSICPAEEHTRFEFFVLSRTALASAHSSKHSNQNHRSLVMKRAKVGRAPNMRLKLSACGGRLRRKGSLLIAAAAGRSLSAIR
jgi:hypothetical protein